MVLCWCLLFSFFIGLTQIEAQYHQSDYGVKIDRMEVINSNPQYMTHVKAAFVWYNRTQRVVNGSANFVQNLTADLKIDIQMYKFLSNEYRYFPITLSIGLCDTLNKNSFGMGDMVNKYSNLKNCPPIKAGFHYIRNAIIDFSAFPPHIPGGQYKLAAKVLYNSHFVLEVHFYGTVQTFITKWEN